MTHSEPDKPSGRAPDADAVRAQVERITASHEFEASPRSREFLGFVVEQALAGRVTRISQQVIAARVFGRGKDFDPTTDPIVRMQAGRVRRLLEHHYLTAGADDVVVIDLPKGTYVPTFTLRETSLTTARSAVRTPQTGEADGWPTVLVSPLRNLTGRPGLDFIGQGLASDLAAELDRSTEVRVFLSSEPHNKEARPCPARFELNGSVTSGADGLTISLHLIDAATNGQTWARAYHASERADLGVTLDEVVRSAAVVIAEEHGVLHSQLMEELGCRRRGAVGAYEAILRYLHFDLVQTPESFAQALESLSQAVQDNPDCALCWSYLARLGAVHWSTGMPGEVPPIEASVDAARRGVALCPTDLRCRLLLGYVHLVNDQVDQARCEAEMALQLGEGSILWLDGIGYLLTLTGDWERGPGLVRKATRMNPYHRKICHGALWLDALRRGDPEEAMVAAREYTPITNFWHPLMRAAAAAAGNDMDEAISQGRRLLELRPDFPERGRWLISRYIKFSGLVATITQALDSAGVELADSPAGACGR